MLDIGILTGTRISVLKKVKPITYLIALIMPPIQAAGAIILANFIGLSPGGATVFAVLAAGASYNRLSRIYGYQSLYNLSRYFWTGK